MSGGRRNGPRTVAARVLAILGSFTSAQQKLTLAEISRRTGLAFSTTHRLVNELHAWGALEREQDLRYRIGARLRELTTAGPIDRKRTQA
jgi:DNA-binding IclR family transcriptional regulator